MIEKIKYKLNKISKFINRVNQLISIYLYKNSLKYQNYEIEKINYINNLDEYQKNLTKLNKELFIFKDLEKNNFKLNKFCKVNRKKSETNKIIFNVESNNKDCIAIFPIPFSYNNNFLIKDNLLKNKCDTFRAQFYFHACIFSEDTLIEHKKNNIILYPLGSLKDFIENKKRKILY